jgi:dienelactone hydrolase
VTVLELPLVDEERGRALTTVVRVPDAGSPAPLIVFGHGFTGHPRKFTKLLGAWADSGYAVVAPAFPFTNDEAPGEPIFDDVVNQPADIRFVIDALLDSYELRGLLDPGRIGVAGFSLGGVTALAVGFNPAHRDPRATAVAVVSGGFWEVLGGPHEMEAKPLLVVHGIDDEIVPFARGEEVYRAARPPKVFVVLAGGRHHEEIEDGEGPIPAVVDATLAFWDLFLRGDADAHKRLLAKRPGITRRSAGI